MLVGVPVILLASVAVILWQPPSTPRVTKINPSNNQGHSVGVERNPNITQVTTTLNNQIAVQYIDQVGKYSITIPTDWDVSGSLVYKNDLKTTQISASQVLEDYGIRKVEQAFYTESTPQSFDQYLQKDSSGLTTYSNNFVYTLNGLPVRHLESTNNGKKMIIDFIERPDTGSNVVITRNDKVDSLPYFRDIIQSIELIGNKLPDSVLMARTGIVSRNSSTINFATKDYTITIPSDWEIENDDYGATGYDWDLSTPTNTVAFFGPPDNPNNPEGSYSMHIFTTDASINEVISSYLDFVNNNETGFKLSVQASSTTIMAGKKIYRTDVDDYIGIGNTIFYLENKGGKNIVVIARFAGSLKIKKVLESIKVL